MNSKAKRTAKMLAGLTPELRSLLTSGGVSERERLDPDEAERRIRSSMANEIDDLVVSYHVARGRAEGCASITMIEHICYLPHAECVRGTHGYWLRCAGPITREVHERQERRIAEFPTFMERIKASLVFEGADRIAKARANAAVAAFRERLARGEPRRLGG